jgi:hypothetical protein
MLWILSILIVSPDLVANEGEVIVAADNAMADFRKLRRFSGMIFPFKII